MLEENSIRPVFEKHNVVIVVADLSTNDQRIWKELIEDVGERGLPVNLIYPPGEGGEPIMLPKLLSVSNISEALAKVATGPPDA